MRNTHLHSPKPATMSRSLAFFLSLLFFLSRATATTIGVTYTSSPSLPPPEELIAVLQSLKIAAVRLPNPNPNIIRSFICTNISLFLSIPNSLIPSIAENRSAALPWLYDHVIPYYPRARITAISVGTNVLASGDVTTVDLIVPAVRNVRQSLIDIGITQITVSTTFSFVNIITTSFPPSSAQFQQPAGDMVIKPLLDLLSETNSSLFVSLYPYSVFKLRAEIPIGFALFQEHAFNFRDDTITGVRYRNLFDLMIDAVIVAMAVAGHENIPIVIAETGWPCYDPSNEAAGRQVYSEMYLNGLVNHIRSGKGTPLRKEGVTEVYIYEMFDSNETEITKGLRSDSTGENWGICYSNMTRKFNIDYSSGCSTTKEKEDNFWYIFFFFWLMCVLNPSISPLVFVDFDGD